MIPVTLIWTVIAFAGFLVQLWAISDSFADRRALLIVGAPNGRRRLVNGHIRAAVGFCLIHLLFAFAGLSALLSLGRDFTVWSLIVAALLLVGNGLLDRRDRRILRTKGAP